MNKIGIIGAMDEEIKALVSKFEGIETKRIAGMDFHEGTINGKQAVVVKCGIGKVNAAVSAQILVDVFKAQSVINTGVAGALDPSLSVLDIVISKDCVQHDFDCTGFGYAPGVVPGLGSENSFFKADEKLIAAAKSSAEKILAGRLALVGRIASGDLFVTAKEDKERIVSTFSAACAEMEGAAIGQTCCLNNIPFVVIRAMSDTASGSAAADFKVFAGEAAKQSAEVVIDMLDGFNYNGFSQNRRIHEGKYK